MFRNDRVMSYTTLLNKPIRWRKVSLSMTSVSIELSDS